MRNFLLQEIAGLFWGSKAVRAISLLPCKDHCETIILDRNIHLLYLTSSILNLTLFKSSLPMMVKDIAVFNQMACSSPCSVYGKNKYPIMTIASWIQDTFKDLPETLRNQEISTGHSSKIINTRTRYLLSDEKNCIAPSDLSWTILIDQEICLEEPIQGKCIFIKEINSINDVIPW